MKTGNMAQQIVSLSMTILFISGWVQPDEVSPPVQNQKIPSHEEVLALQGTVYYVSPTGSNSNPGTKARPWRTIQKAANTLVAGDTVYIKAGTYQERVVPQNSGSADNYIVYAAYPGDTVTINGDGISLPSEWGGLFDVADKSYIRISGLRIINAGPNDNNVGILVDSSSHIIIEKNYTYNTASSGIGVWDSDNIIIDGNEVELACNDGEQECITVAGTNIFEIKNNHVHHGGPGTNGGEGIDAKDGSSNGKIYKNHVHHLQRLGIYVDAWDKHTYNIQIFQNVVHDTEDDGFTVASEAGGILENVRIYNNIAYNNKFCGMTISRNGYAPNHPMKDITVINNTFYNNGRNPWGGGIAVDNPNVQNVVLRNNICSQNLSFQIEVEADVPMRNLTVDYNLIDGYRGYEGEIYGSHYVEGDPMFVYPSEANFHLQANSPAIDKGSSVDAPNDDFDGYPRYANPDIGAFEYSMLKVTPPSRAIDPGGLATYIISVGSSGGSTATVNLVAASPSPSLTLQLVPTSVIPPGQATLTVTDSHTGPALLPGLWYIVPITATDGVTQTTSVSLLVGGARLYLPVVLKSY